MTSKDYAEIEDLLVKAETVTMRHVLLTPQGKQTQDEIRQLLRKVTMERLRAQVSEAKERRSSN